MQSAPSRSRRAGLVLAAALVVACGGAAPRNVLLVVVDTMRWDRLGSYGHVRDTSPNLDALAAEGVRFERAYATAPWTMPSVASMITGLYPSGHGVVTALTGIPLSTVTLAEILRERGFQTGAVVSNRLLSSRQGRGFTQGYEIYRSSEARGHDHVSTQGVTHQSIAILEEFARSDAPFLLFVHYFDPHFNYRRHREVDFAPERVGSLDGRQDIHELRRMLKDLSQEEIDFLLDLYDEEVFFTDAGIGRLLDALRRLGRYDDTVIIVTSDHGEEFRDHGWLGHTRSLYQELVRVPLIVSAPAHRGRSRVVEEPVSLVSITPTVLELLGIDAPGVSFHEPSLASRIRGESARASDFVLTEVGFLPPGAPRGAKRAFKKGIVGDRFKLIRDEETHAIEVYDLESDPGETRNLADERPELRDRLLGALEDRLRRAREAATEPDLHHVTEEEIETLRGLGYVDS